MGQASDSNSARPATLGAASTFLRKPQADIIQQLTSRVEKHESSKKNKAVIKGSRQKGQCQIGTVKQV
jgi:hypothetical protein